VISNYTRAIEMAGGAPVAIPLELGEEALRDIFARLDGLLLAGGLDVHPGEFGETVEPFCGDIDQARDAVELDLSRRAIGEKMPVLGICRGVQVLNVASGGTLYQDLPAQMEHVLPHAHVPGAPRNQRTHTIEIDSSSRLARIFGTTQLQVSSLHHQAIKRVAPGFRVVARAPDGIVEAVESTNGQFAVGVQFHPEDLVDDDERMLGLFEEFVRTTQSKDRSVA
jgi:putative glutamine amidotransferase